MRSLFWGCGAAALLGCEGSKSGQGATEAVSTTHEGFEWPLEISETIAAELLDIEKSTKAPVLFVDKRIEDIPKNIWFFLEEVEYSSGGSVKVCAWRCASRMKRNFKQLNEGSWPQLHEGNLLEALFKEFKGSSSFDTPSRMCLSGTRKEYKDPRSGAGFAFTTAQLHSAGKVGILGDLIATYSLITVWNWESPHTVRWKTVALQSASEMDVKLAAARSKRKSLHTVVPKTVVDEVRIQPGALWRRSSDSGDTHSVRICRDYTAGLTAANMLQELSAANMLQTLSAEMSPEGEDWVKSLFTFAAVGRSHFDGGYRQRGCVERRQINYTFENKGISEIEIEEIDLKKGTKYTHVVRLEWGDDTRLTEVEKMKKQFTQAHGKLTQVSWLPKPVTDKEWEKHSKTKKDSPFSISEDVHHSALVTFIPPVKIVDNKMKLCRTLSEEGESTKATDGLVYSLETYFNLWVEVFENENAFGEWFQLFVLKFLLYEHRGVKPYGDGSGNHDGMGDQGNNQLCLHGIIENFVNEEDPFKGVLSWISLELKVGSQEPLLSLATLSRSRMDGARWLETNLKEPKPLLLATDKYYDERNQQQRMFHIPGPDELMLVPKGATIKVTGHSVNISICREAGKAALAKVARVAEDAEAKVAEAMSAVAEGAAKLHHAPVKNWLFRKMGRFVTFSAPLLIPYNPEIPPSKIEQGVCMVVVRETFKEVGTGKSFARTKIKYEIRNKGKTVVVESNELTAEWDTEGDREVVWKTDSNLSTKLQNSNAGDQAQHFKYQLTEEPRPVRLPPVGMWIEIRGNDKIKTQAIEVCRSDARFGFPNLKDQLEAPHSDMFARFLRVWMDMSPNVKVDTDTCVTVTGSRYQGLNSGVNLVQLKIVNAVKEDSEVLALKRYESWEVPHLAEQLLANRKEVRKRHASRKSRHSKEGKSRKHKKRQRSRQGRNATIKKTKRHHKHHRGKKSKLAKTT